MMATSFDVVDLTLTTDEESSDSDSVMVVEDAAKPPKKEGYLHNAHTIISTLHRPITSSASSILNFAKSISSIAGSLRYNYTLYSLSQPLH